MKRILLVNPPGAFNKHSAGMLRLIESRLPLLSIATLGAVAKGCGVYVKAVDLGVSENAADELDTALRRVHPDLVGVTVTTPLYGAACRVADRAKQLCPRTTVAVGGPHATAFSGEMLGRGSIDLVVRGEGERTFAELLAKDSPVGVDGVVYKEGDRIVANPDRALIEDMDALPMPAWEMFDLRKYRSSRLIWRRSRVGGLETTRGCCFNCSFCDKTVFGRRVRSKSPSRTVSEIEYMLECGFEEIHFRGDLFLANTGWAETICRRIMDRGLKFPWNLQYGLRVDRVSERILDLARRAGCYGVSFGIESGSQDVLDAMNKRTTVEQCHRAIEMAHRLGLQTTGFFIVGYLNECERTIRETLEFTKRRPQLDFLKATRAVPLPNTTFFDRLKADSRILTEQWEHYYFQTERPVFAHPHLTSRQITAAYNTLYTSFYLRAETLRRTIRRAVRNRTVLMHLWFAVRMSVICLVRFVRSANRRADASRPGARSGAVRRAAPSTRGARR